MRIAVFAVALLFPQSRRKRIVTVLTYHDALSQDRAGGT